MCECQNYVELKIIHEKVSNVSGLESCGDHAMPFMHVYLPNFDFVGRSPVLFLELLNDLVTIFEKAPRTDPKEEQRFAGFWLVRLTTSRKPFIFDC